MLGDARLTAFVATANSDEARHFYEDTLGLRFVADSQFALVFDANGVELRVQKVDSVPPPSATVLGWQVSELTQVVAELSRRGVSIEQFPLLEQDALGIWTSPDGTRVAWFKDPDGNMLSVTQPAARSQAG